MEKLQEGPINSCLFQEELECLEEENGALDMGMSYGQFMSNFEDPYSNEEGSTDPHYCLPSLEDKMPFLQMLQGVESHQQPPLTPSSPFFPLIQEPNFQLLLRLQHQKLMKPFSDYNDTIISCLASAELESCVTNNDMDMVMDMHSPIAAGTSERETQMTTMGVEKSSGRSKKSQACTGMIATKEKRKRKRTNTRPSKNKEEVESQRMTHIAVERNRRRQMNEHLNALRSLMPPSYVQRGDQASIIGGAIDFVKESEQLLQTLEAQKRVRQCEDQNGDVSASSSTSSPSDLLNNMFMSPTSSTTTTTTTPFEFRYPHSHDEGNVNGNGNPSSIERVKISEEISAENRSALADIHVMVIQNHVNLKIRCQKRPGQLLNAIVALEQLRFTVLHLNVTSLHSFVHYSFNLKIEEDCTLGSADEVASTVHQIFRFLNSS